MHSCDVYPVLGLSTGICWNALLLLEATPSASIYGAVFRSLYHTSSPLILFLSSLFFLPTFSLIITYHFSRSPFLCLFFFLYPSHTFVKSVVAVAQSYKSHNSLLGVMNRESQKV